MKKLVRVYGAVFTNQITKVRREEEFRAYSDNEATKVAETKCRKDEKCTQLRLSREMDF